MVEACNHIGTIEDQYEAMATALAAMKGPSESAEVCFGCGKPGHLKRDCLALKGDKSKVLPLCQRCRKGWHYTNKCSSKYDAEGRLIQGNWKLSAGQHPAPIQMPQLPQQMTPQKPPLQMSHRVSAQVFTQQLQAVFDWIWPLQSQNWPEVDPGQECKTISRIFGSSTERGLPSL